jgi:hypothetical protein
MYSEERLQLPLYSISYKILMRLIAKTLSLVPDCFRFGVSLLDCYYSKVISRCFEAVAPLLLDRHYYSFKIVKMSCNLWALD